MKRFGFFNSINGDRKYLASDIAKAFDIGVSTGLKADREDNFQIIPYENMTVKMLPGGAMIFGHYILDEEDELITLDLADGEMSRIDRIVLRYDKYERSIKAVVIKGTPALTPTAPVPLRTEEQFDLVLADIYIRKATTEILASDITDMRNTDLCGFIGVKGAVSQLEFDRHLADYALWRDKSALWKRIDRLTSTIEITSTDYTKPTLIPLSEPYNQGTTYAVEFSGAGDMRNSQFVIFTHRSGSAGNLVAGANNNGVITVSRISSSIDQSAIGFYNPSAPLRVGSVYIVKEG